MADSKLKISIITTCLNCVEFVEETVKSILSQEGEFELEYIITDGGSTDGSWEIIQKYKEKIIATSERDSGQSNGINKGLKRATGDIIAFLNADDLYQTGALQLVTEHFKSNPSSMWVTGICEIINAEGKQKFLRNLIKGYKNSTLKRISLQRLVVDNTISQPATFWRKELMDQCGYLNEELHYCMDYEFWCRMITIAPLVYIPKPLASFRIHSSTKTGGAFGKQIAERAKITKNYAPNTTVYYMSRLMDLRKWLGYKALAVIGH